MKKWKSNYDPLWLSARTLFLILGGAVAAGWLICASCGCATSVQCSFVRAIQESDRVVMPEYLSYILKDDTLDDDEKQVIFDHVKRRKDLVDREPGECE